MSTQISQAAQATADAQNRGMLASQDLRRRIRSGEFTSHTGGQAPGHVQANLMAVPREYAFDFLLFCQRNPKPCPLLEVTEPGQFAPTRLAPDADLRTDISKYRVWENGELVDEPMDVKDVWTDDYVGFLLGCSFSFEKPLLDAGLDIRYLSEGKNVSMYRTNIECRPAGPFRGKMVVSMRPFMPDEAIQATRITGDLPQVHGAPIHQGDPARIGIADLAQPDYGDAQNLREGEIPLFWACGVTPQSVLLESKIPRAITHAPGHMFVSDILEGDLRWFSESVK